MRSMRTPKHTFMGKINKKIYFFVGTTTELIKLSPIISELEKRKINFKIIASGQTKIKFDELSLIIKKRKADISLGDKIDRSSVIKFSLWSISAFLKAFSLRKEFKGLNSKNSYFIVHGDPVSSLIGAVVAKFYRLKLVHIESGLRSFNFLEPFPEEICRVLISGMADIHFCPNEWAMKNLSHGKGEKVNTFQNTLIESYWRVASKKKLYDKELELGSKKYFVLIVHRQEHVIFGKEKSEQLIKFILDNSPKNMTCVFVTHAITSNFLESVKFKLGIHKNRVRLVSRLHYPEFVSLLDNAQFVLTDGGSNQEELYYMGVPCVLLRNDTERIEGLGENVVLSKGKKTIIKSFMKNYKKYRRDKIKIKKRPSKIIVDKLEN